MVVGAGKGYYEWVERCLVWNHVDPNYLHSKYGTTALAMGAREGHVRIVRLLLNHGAHPDVRCLVRRAALRPARSRMLLTPSARWRAGNCSMTEPRLCCLPSIAARSTSLPRSSKRGRATRSLITCVRGPRSADVATV